MSTASRTSTTLFMIVAAAMSTGCIQIADLQKVNTSLPEDFSNRVVYRDSSSVRDNLPDFVGHVVEIERSTGTANKSLVRFVKEGFMPVVQVVDPAAGKLYESKISSGFKTSQKVNYLATIDVNVTGDQMLQVLIQDASFINLDTAKVDVDALKAYVATLQPKAGYLRCFVQGARVATINYKVYQKITGVVKAAYGETFQSGNEIYSTNQSYMQDFKVSVDCIDLDTVSPLLGDRALAAAEATRLLEDTLKNPQKYAPKEGIVLLGRPR